MLRKAADNYSNLITFKKLLYTIEYQPNAFISKTPLSSSTNWSKSNKLTFSGENRIESIDCHWADLCPLAIYSLFIEPRTNKFLIDFRHRDISVVRHFNFLLYPIVLSIYTPL